MLEVEDWTQPSPNKRRGISKKGASEKSDSGTREANFQPSSSPSPLVAPGPPDDEIELFSHPIRGIFRYGQGLIHRHPLAFLYCPDY